MNLERSQIEIQVLDKNLSIDIIYILLVIDPRVWGRRRKNIDYLRKGEVFKLVARRIGRVEDQREKIEMRRAYIRIKRPLEVEWTCPGCAKVNKEFFYNLPGKTRVKCSWCGEIFIGQR